MSAVVFVVAGAVGLVTGPLIGKWSDKVGKFRVFIDGSILATIMVLIVASGIVASSIWMRYQNKRRERDMRLAAAANL